MAAPIKINCENLRTERQQENNRIMFRALITKDSVLVKRFCNNNELFRVLTELSEIFMRKFTLEELLYKCSFDRIYAMTLAGRISKVSSRQANKDEVYILAKCSQTVSQVGIEITKLSTTEFRPTKDGRILTNKEYKQSGLQKSSCLKSFDARISGRVSGWVFAKVVFGSGGHQDNVFAEAHEFGEWVQKYGEASKLYVILIDTDLNSQFQELKKKFQGQNILVCDHFEFQMYLLSVK